MNHLATFLAVLSPTLLIAQARTPAPGVVIEGSANPEKISEFTSVVMFFRSTAGPDAPDVPDPARLSAQLKPIGLRPTDEHYLRDAIAAFRAGSLQTKPAMDALAASIPQTRSMEQTRQYQALKQQLHSTAFTLYNKVLAQMSPQGKAALRSHVLSIRSHMTVIAQPKM